MRKIPTFLVEDNPTIRAQLLATLAELTPVECVGFADTEAGAVQWLKAHPNAWDLVLVDLFLKEGSGMGVLAALNNRTERQKAVVISNYATQDVTKRCLELGSDGVFDKSEDIDALLEFCQNL